MSPCVVMAVSNAAAGRRAQALLMRLGGEYGFHWQRQGMPRGGAVFCVGSAPEDLRDALKAQLRAYMGAGRDWIINEWRQPMGAKQMRLAESWWVPAPRAGAGTHG